MLHARSHGSATITDKLQRSTNMRQYFGFAWNKFTGVEAPAIYGLKATT
jgi:hypothetical protein